MFMLEGVVLLFVAAVLILFLFRRPDREQLPPGSMGFPLLGETLDFLRLSNIKLWEFFLVREAKYGKVYKTFLFGSPVAVLTPPLGSRLLLANHHKLVGKAWPLPLVKLFPDNILIHTDGPKSKGYRQILMDFLGPDAIQNNVHATSDIVQEHLENYWKAGEVLAYPLIKHCFFSIVCKMFLSLVNREHVMELMQPFDTVTHGLISIPIDLPWTTFHKTKCARDKIYDILGRHITERRMQLQAATVTPVQRDLLTVLLTTDVTGEGHMMTDEEIKDNVLGLLLAGHESTASLMSMAIRCLAENQDCYNEVKRAHRDIQSSKDLGEPLNWKDLKLMKYSWKVLQETLRARPVAPLIFRKALVDIKVEGFTIPKGWQLFSTGYCSHTKEEFFPNPSKFDPSRFEGSGPVPYTYFPFGGGPRICSGIEQAKMLNLVLLHHFVIRYDWTLLDPEEPIKLVPVATPAHDLPLKLSLSAI